MMQERTQTFYNTEKRALSASIDGSYRGKDILSFDQFSASDLYALFLLTRRMKQLVVNHEASHLLEGLIVSLLFF